MQIVLGSNSPRRRELLAGMGVSFTAVNIHADESFPPSLQGADIPLYISQAKARAYTPKAISGTPENKVNAISKDKLEIVLEGELSSISKDTLSLMPEGELLITADTIVWVDNQQLGKPSDENDAFRMLSLLSGKTHQVFTAVTLRYLKDGCDTIESFVDRTDVTFRSLTEDEIWYYIRTYRPMDKAGAYGIQEWIGYIACTALNGSYFNVMGLPTEKLYTALQACQHTKK